MKRIISALLAAAVALPFAGAVTVSAADGARDLQIETKFYAGDESYTLSIPTTETKTVKLIEATYGDGGALTGSVVYDYSLAANQAEYTVIHRGGGGEYAYRKFFMVDNGEITPVTAYRDGRVYGYSDGDKLCAEVTVSNVSDHTAPVIIEYDDALPVKSFEVSPHSTAVSSIYFTADKDSYHINVREAGGYLPAEYDGGYICKSDVTFPETAPFEAEYDATPTFGAHDPTIFHNPADGKYYAYSSHNLIFVSDDLINWEKYNFTTNPENNTGIQVTVPKSSADFIAENYPGTEVNGTYWAPDVLYMENDEYPYWFYTSVSCGLGGRNSVIDLVKAKSPLIWDGEYIDCGVVLASKESNDYFTNAIDEHIYTDTDGRRYFIWGSFWQGIHAAPLNNNGTAAGIDGASSGDKKDKTIKTVSGADMLEKSKGFGTRIFSAPAGVFGPEGPWMVYNEDTGYRYLFTSYGWLGTNYNIRVARTDKTMAQILSGANPSEDFRDYNDNHVGIAYDKQEDKSRLWGYKMLGSYSLGDGITYYGNGHCSVFKDDDGEWYLVEHCRKIADATAYLQVRKILWTSDGWPVVSPVVYSGEKQQTIPREMLYGTYDLSSVGQTIFAEGVTDVSACSSSSADLPVVSSKIVLLPDGTIGDDLGTWSFDGEYTVTLKFTVDGDDEDYEFYKNGDTMTMFVTAAYDRDKREKALVMSGADQNGVTQLMKKADESLDGINDYVTSVSTAPRTALRDTFAIRNGNEHYIIHSPFNTVENTSRFPTGKSVFAGTEFIDPQDAAWVISEPLYTPEGESHENYVSIQSANKPGMYLKASNDGIALVEAKKDDYTSVKKRMTFKTAAGLDGNYYSYSLESAAKPGMFAAVSNGALILADGSDADACSFTFTDVPAADESTDTDGYTSKFEFEDNLTDAVTGKSGTTTGALSTIPAKSETASYGEGYHGRAVSFTGAGSDGVNLGHIITEKAYTVSFMFKANEITKFSAGMFISTPGGGQKWISAPFGNRGSGILNVWSYGASGYLNYASEVTAKPDEWHNVTMVVIGSGLYLYIDGESAGLGEVAEITEDNTNTFLAVNEWDTPFNGYIDDLYVWNGRALNENEVKAFFSAVR